MSDSQQTGPDLARMVWQRQYFLLLLISLSLVLGACAPGSEITPTAAGVSFVTATVTSTGSPTAVPPTTPTPVDHATSSPPTPLSTPTDTPTTTPTPTFTPTPTLTPTLTPPPMPDTEAPPIPKPLAPAQGTQLECEPGRETRTVRLELEAVSDSSGFVRYEAQIEPSGYYSVIEAKPETTYIDIEARCGVNYTWQVRAIDGTGNASDWSAAFTFSLIFPDQQGPTTPPLISPRDEHYILCDKGETRSITFEWGAAVDERSDVAGYYFAIQRQGDSDWKPSDLLKAHSFTRTVPCGYWYRWTVKAIDSLGNIGEWSEPYKIYAGPDIWKPATPRLKSPAHGERLQCPPGRNSRAVELRWEPVEDWSGIDRYYVQVREIYDENNPIIIDDNTQRTYYTTRRLSCNQNYAWAVIARDRSGNLSADWSSPRLFRIEK